MRFIGDSKGASMAGRLLVAHYQYHQHVNALDDNMVSLYRLCVYRLCFCSATKSFAIQKGIF